MGVTIVTPINLLSLNTFCLPVEHLRLLGFETSSPTNDSLLVSLRIGLI